MTTFTTLQICRPREPEVRLNCEGGFTHVTLRDSDVVVTLSFKDGEAARQWFDAVLGELPDAPKDTVDCIYCRDAGCEHCIGYRDAKGWHEPKAVRA